MRLSSLVGMCLMLKPLSEALFSGGDAKTAQWGALFSGGDVKTAQWGSLLWWGCV